MSNYCSPNATNTKKIVLNVGEHQLIQIIFINKKIINLERTRIMNFTEMRNKLIENFNDITKDVTHLFEVNVDKELEIKINIVKYIVSTKLEERKARENETMKKIQKQKIMSAIAAKEDEVLQNSSIQFYRGFKENAQ